MFHYWWIINSCCLVKASNYYCTETTGIAFLKGKLKVNELKSFYYQFLDFKWLYKNYHSYGFSCNGKHFNSITSNFNKFRCLFFFTVEHRWKLQKLFPPMTNLSHLNWAKRRRCNFTRFASVIDKKREREEHSVCLNCRFIRRRQKERVRKKERDRERGTFFNIA